jgi:hypothetical protein
MTRENVTWADYIIAMVERRRRSYRFPLYPSTLDYGSRVNFILSSVILRPYPTITPFPARTGVSKVS